MRKWLAYKLVLLAGRIHDPSFYSVIFPAADSDSYVLITNNSYGDGVSAGCRVRWLGDDGEAPSEPPGYPLEWADFSDLDKAYEYIEERRA
jgi:hypothetical protein